MVDFDRSLGALQADGAGEALIWLLCGGALLAAWGFWFANATITEYEVSSQARVEVARAAHPIDSPVAGRVVRSGLVLGAVVRAGDVVVELDAEAERHRLAEERARLVAITLELEALERVLVAEEDALVGDRESSLTALREGRARWKEAEIDAAFAREEAGRVARLSDDGLVGSAEASRTRSEADKRRATSLVLALAIDKQRTEQRVRESRSRGQVERLRHELAELEGRRLFSDAAIRSLSYEIERRSLRAPIDGQVADNAALEAGAYVQEGARVGAIVPAGSLELIALFPPSTAAGRLRPGQDARLRLDSYPWGEFGTLSARVRSVASEPRNGSLRVELSLDPSSNPRIPLEHGLVGTVEVVVLELSPAALVERAAGGWLEAMPGVALK